jgi:5-hydroxyisourate hydrolase-like protein (transthyretin family)
MKKKLYVFVTMALLAGCSKHDSPAPQPQTQPLIVKDVNSPLYFKITPQSPAQLKISFLYNPGRSLTKLYLKKDTATVGTYALSNDGNDYYSAVVNYDFAAGQPYKLVVQSSGINDTAFRYTLPNYTHTYLSPLQYEKLLGLTQSLGPKAFDFSPSRNVIFITDDVNNSLIIKRLNLNDLKIDTLGSAINGLMIRAVSDSVVLSMSGTYNNRFLQEDSAALMRYNVNTGHSSFIDFVSRDYGRFSRVIKDHILVTEPYYSSGNSALINLNDNSKVIYPYSSFDFRYIGEFNFDHLYYENYVVDPATGALQSPLPLTDSSGIDYIDSSTQYTIVSKYVQKRTAPDYYTSRLSVYSKSGLIYQGDYVNTCSMQIGRQLSISNNRILLYQSFGYDTTFRIDGYYMLDLNTRQLNLLQCDSNPYVMMDFQLDPHSMISVRADGIYRVRIP